MAVLTMNAFRFLKDSASRQPDHTAVVDGNHIWTYDELRSATDALADKLMQHGVEAGAGLGILGRNSVGFIAATFAGFKAGATIVPLSHQLKSSELRDVLTDIQLRACLYDGHGPRPDGYEVLTIRLGDTDWVLLRFESEPVHPCSPLPDAAYVRFTSGTTGTAKGVVISHRALDERTEAANRGLHIGPKDRVLWVLPMAFHLLVSIVLYVRYGATIVLCPTILAQTMLELAEDHPCTVFYGSPMHFRMLAADTSERRLDSLRLAISTSSGIPSHVVDAFSQRYNIPVTQAYGIIEVGLPLINTDAATAHPAAIGRALPDYQVGILDDHGQPVPTGSIGQLAMQGPGMFDAYLSPFMSVEQVLQDGWFMTGDLATVTDDGLVTLAGREKSVINVSGNKVFPEEVEHVLTTHPHIQAARVSGAAHPLTGEIVEADIILQGVESIDSESIVAYCRDHLSTYKVPQRIRVVEQLPHTRSGKILRT